jgi:hypothetical protein
MSADTVFAVQLMYALANAATARLGEGDARRTRCGLGDGDGYSCVACALASGDAWRLRGTG